MAQYEKPMTDTPSSPALEALYNDLDSFINELSGELPEQATSHNIYVASRRYSNDELSHINRVSYLYEGDESGYSPVLESYARPFSELRSTSTHGLFKEVQPSQAEEEAEATTHNIDSEENEKTIENEDEEEEEDEEEDEDQASANNSDSEKEETSAKNKYVAEEPISHRDKEIDENLIESEEEPCDKEPLQPERLHKDSTQPQNEGEQSEHQSQDDPQQGNEHIPSPLLSSALYKDTLSPPTSPSYLSITQQARPFAPNRQHITKIAMENHVVYTTRSSSLNRQTSQSSARSLAAMPTIRRGFSNPTSPLSTDVTQHMYEPMVSVTECPDIFFPNYPLISELGDKMIAEVKYLNERRRIFCTAEYPRSFTGEEAVEIMRMLLPTGLPDVMYRKVARALMHTSPPLISPISYSEKSTRKNTLYDSPHETYTLVEETLELGVPQGVYTPLTRCYTNSCLPGQGGCYAPRCPNKDLQPSDRPKQGSTLQRHASITSSIASSHDTSLSRAWSASVSREILQNTPDNEIKRQEAIHEIIYTEEDYVRDLNLLDELYATPLRSAQCIEEDSREGFCNNVFNNYMDILQIHKDLYRELRDHQSHCQSQNNGGFVDKVGDIFLQHLPKFMDAYATYGPHVVLAEYAVKKEMNNNILFQNFVHEKERQAECRKLPFRHFIILPVTRLQRYPLLLGAILKKTPDDHPDKEPLTKCSEILKSVANRMDELTATTKNTLRVYEINDRIRFKPGQVHDLQLLNPGRKLIHEGLLTRRSHIVIETLELHVFLFDHMLLMTKVKKTAENDDEYHISKRPIPLELLYVPEATEGFALGYRSMTAGSVLPASQNPLQLRHLGRNGDDYLLHAENSDVRVEWKEKIVDAKAKLEQAYPDRQVFEVRSLSDTTFTGSSGMGVNFSQGKVTCSVPFRIRMIAIGSISGIWMGIEGDTSSIRHVLSIADVSQIAILEDEHILLILADKTLMAYALDALDPTAPIKPADRPNQRIAQHITYFNAGVCNNRTLVIAMKKRGMDSHFKAFEPVCGDLRDPGNAKFLTTKTSFFSKAPVWFKTYKEFYIGADSSAVHFLKARIFVVCVRGFEIIDLENLSMNRNLPDLQNPDFAFVQQRGEEPNPLGMFRCKEHYLLCYDTFAFLVDSHGSFVQDPNSKIEWEGTPEAVAFYYPYVVGFDYQFIEVRHAVTGELIQILAGEHMRCLQFRNDTFAPVIHGCMAHPFKPDFQYVFQLIANFEPPL
ncbi:RHO1 GDP-GTP exchange protein 2 [Apophysomyces sp. BC1034]|nr:RHO1 GDP-GTP exchange protein 2 [Apophysomyces sp. BC1015]KAG0179453.1 RHO1 GDP-GTP exchange protein 2 [Apophysomyces sp. BC1021]KAG0190037.1 RHO1 GDP-GTP exchange protein 2 [Apophysomyces sp. BC1034]